MTSGLDVSLLVGQLEIGVVNMKKCRMTRISALIGCMTALVACAPQEGEGQIDIEEQIIVSISEEADVSLEEAREIFDNEVIHAEASPEELHLLSGEGCEILSITERWLPADRNIWPIAPGSQYVAGNRWGELRARGNCLQLCANWTGYGTTELPHTTYKRYAYLNWSSGLAVCYADARPEAFQGFNNPNACIISGATVTSRCGNTGSNYIDSSYSWEPHASMPGVWVPVMNRLNGPN